MQAGLVENQPIDLSNRPKSTFDDVDGDGDVGVAGRQQQQPPCQQARLLGCN